MNTSIFLHIGLPKTATTATQKYFFPQIPFYEGKYVVDGGEKLVSGSRIYRLFSDSHERHVRGIDWEKQFSEEVGALELPEKVLISNEVFSMWPSPRNPHASAWPVQSNFRDQKRDEAPIKSYLKRVKELLPYTQINIILTLRNQADLIGSLSAEIPNSHAMAISRICRRQDAFLSYGDLVLDLEEVADKTLVLVFEDGLNHNFQLLSEFIGFNFSYDVLPRANTRSKGKMQWVNNSVWSYLASRTNWQPLRRVFWLANSLFSRSTVMLGKRRQSQIKKTYFDQNRALESYLGRKLGGLGY